MKVSFLKKYDIGDEIVFKKNYHGVDIFGNKFVIKKGSKAQCFCVSSAYIRLYIENCVPINISLVCKEYIGKLKEYPNTSIFRKIYKNYKIKGNKIEVVD